MSLKNRTTLQYAFQNGRVPTGQDFADLIDSFINQLDDGISMTARKTVQIGNPSLNTGLSVGATWSLLSGKVELTKDSAALKGTGTLFGEQLVKGQEIIIASEHYFVSEITDNENLVLNKQAAADLKDASARAIPDIFAVQDAQQNVLLYISRDGKIGIGKKPQTGLDIHGNMTSDGLIQAVRFSGDGSQLTKLNPNNIDGIIPAEHLPQININEITGLLTVNNVFNQVITGTFTGDEGQPMVTGTQDLAAEKLQEGQLVKIGDDVYEISRIINQSLIFKTNLTKKAGHATLYTAGRFLEMNLSGKNILYINGSGDLYTKGAIDAKSFKGDGSKLTNISATEVKGKLSLENLPEINVNEISGKLMVNETFSHAMAGTVSGKDVAQGEKNDVLAVSEDFPIGQLFAGQQIKVGNYKYEVREITENHEILLDSELRESIENDTVFIAGNLLELKTDGRNQLLVEPDGNLFVQGNVDAKTFKGDGSKLTNLPAKEINGIISPDSLPPVHISEITGLLTIQATEGSNFLDFKNPSGNSVANINGNGDLHTDGNIHSSGNITAANLAGNAAGLTNLPASQIQGVISPDNIPPVHISEVTGLLTIQGTEGSNFLDLKNPSGNSVANINGHGDLHTDGNIHSSGNITAASLTGNASGLTNLSASQIQGVISPDNIPPVHISEVTGLLTIQGTEGSDFLNLKNPSGNNIANINGHGDLHTDGNIHSSGNISAASLTGNAAGLTNIPANQISGIIPPDHIPKDLNGQLTIHGKLSDTFLDLKNPEGSSMFNITGKGHLHTEGNMHASGSIAASNFIGNASGLANIPANQLQGVIPPDHIPHDINGPLTIHETNGNPLLLLQNQAHKNVVYIDNGGNVHTDGTMEARSFKGDGSGLTNLPTSGSSNHVQGMLTIDRAFDVSGDATVSGRIGDEKLELNGLFPADMFIGQEVKIGTKRYKVTSMEGTKLGIRPGLQEAISNQKIYASGNFIEMNLEKTNIVNVSYNGDVHTAGTIDARGGFVGNAAGLTNIPANKLTGVFAPDNIPGTVNISQTNGSFTIHGTEGKGFLALKDTKGQEVTNINERGDLNTKGNMHADGKISAGVFEGNASQLFDIPADHIKGIIPVKNLPPQEVSAPRFTFYADRTVKAGPIEFVTLSWTTNDVDQVELQYIDKGMLVITKSPEISLQGSIVTSFYQTTTVTLTVFKEGRIVGQQQITISVIQSPALYMKQLWFEGFPTAYAIEMTGKRFSLNVLTDENLKILVSALQRVSYPLEECYLHVPLLYRNNKQNWKPEVHGVFMQTLLSIQ